jgi:cell division initiation protein
MKITPLEIRQKAFEKVFRGFDKDEVTAYLTSLSHEWEKILDENKELRIKFEAAEKEISKLREVESSLYKTLKTAEDTGANMIQQANKAAELQIKETKMKAENMMRDAKTKSREIIEKGEKQAREIISNMLDEVKALQQDIHQAVNLKESLFSDLRNISNDTLERVDKFSKKKKKMNIDEYVKKAREFANNYELHNLDELSETESKKKSESPQREESPAPAPPPEQNDNRSKSFFDTL